MKVLFLTACLAWTANAFAQSDSLKRDSVKTITLGEATVSATRASEKSPTTFTNVEKKDIEEKNLGQDVPYLLSTTPSVVVTSDAGAGIGYTGMRIRGSDATRVNVTINGIPVNDAESHGVYWVDFPDFASSIENVQIQRGVGTSTNGAGAFGGSVNIQSTAPSNDAYGIVSSSYGSFNTWKNTVNFGTGLTKGFSFDGRLSKITSDGYIDRATSDLKSFYLSGGYYGTKHSLKAIAFSGYEKTYQAWNGVPRAKLIGNVDSLTSHYYSNLNYDGAFYQNPPLTDSINLFASNNRTYNYFTYSNQTDNYQQDYYQLHYTFVPSSYININAALHYTKGKGYYEEYKINDLFANYGLPSAIINFDTLTNTDVIRQKWLDNDFYGFTYSVNYENNNLQLTLGGAGNRYTGRHFNQVLWLSAASAPYPFIYEDNDATKNDFNVFLKGMYSITPAVHLFADVQYRTIDYSFPGHITLADIAQQKNKMNFFNPKAGITFDLNAHTNMYASVATGHKEPVRDDFVNAAPGQLPKPEEVIDYEAGLRSNDAHFNTQINFYYMHYNNQLILTGKLNDVGEYIRENVEKSYRAGVELLVTYKASEKFTLQLTTTLSRNKINTFYETLIDYGNTNDQVVFRHQNPDIAFSPSITGASEINYSAFKNFNVSLISRYVGKQYMDNTSNDYRSLDPYFVNDLIFSYHIKPSFTKDIALRFGIYNVLDEMYESNGYTFSYIYGAVITENFYYPQAGRNFLGSITVKF